MTAHLLTNIGELSTQDDELGRIADAALVIDGTRQTIEKPMINEQRL